MGNYNLFPATFLQHLMMVSGGETEAGHHEQDTLTDNIMDCIPLLVYNVICNLKADR